MIEKKQRNREKERYLHALQKEKEEQERQHHQEAIQRFLQRKRLPHPHTAEEEEDLSVPKRKVKKRTTLPTTHIRRGLKHKSLKNSSLPLNLRKKLDLQQHKVPKTPRISSSFLPSSNSTSSSSQSHPLYPHVNLKLAQKRARSHKRIAGPHPDIDISRFYKVIPQLPPADFFLPDSFFR